MEKCIDVHQRFVLFQQHNNKTFEYLTPLTLITIQLQMNDNNNSHIKNTIISPNTAQLVINENPNQL